MEVVQFVPQLGKALWNLKGMYDQHVENGNEIKELQSFIQDYDQQIPILRERFQEGGGNVMGIAAFKNLEKDVMEATNKLERWSRNKSFFQLFNSAERMQKLGKLHSKVMASVQKSLGIANLSMLLDLQVTQATILESNAELKSLLITSIESMHGTLSTKVRDEVVEASTSSFGDPKFWEDVLAVVDNHNATISSFEEKNMYEDPITTNLMIDPIVASDGNTYCRWTIIYNNLTTNPFNVDEDLTIVIDNLTFRRGLFEKFPEQAQIFRQRRNDYRSHAFSLKAKGLWGDALLALHYVLQWNKHDVECIEGLQQVQRALEEAKDKYLQPCNHDVECIEALEQVQEAQQEAKEKYLQPSMVLSNEPGNGGSIQGCHIGRVEVIGRDGRTSEPDRTNGRFRQSGCLSFLKFFNLQVASTLAVRAGISARTWTSGRRRHRQDGDCTRHGLLVRARTQGCGLLFKARTQGRGFLVKARTQGRGLLVRARTQRHGLLVRARMQGRRFFVKVRTQGCPTPQP